MKGINKALTIVVFVIAFAKAYTAHAQYTRHTVKQGESIGTITDKYDVDPAALVKLNPDLKSGLKVGSVLLIPENSTIRKIEGYLDHRVKQKENLFRLSQKYGVSVRDIKDANKHLYSEELKFDETIRIPIISERTDGGEVEKTALASGQYRVQQGDGYRAIARKFNIKPGELRKLNPEAGSLKPGMILNVPLADNKPVSQLGNKPETKKDSLFIDYKVPPKMTFYSLGKLTGIDRDSLIELNPELREGVKENMILRIPDTTSTGVDMSRSRKVAHLQDSLINFRRQRVALILPLSIQEMENDSLRKAHLKKDKASRIALDFYTGVQMARDSVRKLGLEVMLDVYDSQKNSSQVSRIFDSNDFSKYHAVIGPLTSKNVLKATQKLSSREVPVISPLTLTSGSASRNLFQSRPRESVKKEVMMDYLKRNGKGKKIILLADQAHADLKKQILESYPETRVMQPDGNNYIHAAEFKKAVSEEQPNWVIVATDNMSLVTVAISSLSAKAAETDIQMFSFDYGDAFSQADNDQLARLKFTYPSINRISQTNEGFSQAYTDRYGITPNTYAVRGFDLAMDVFLRLASAEDLYQSASLNGMTRYMENSFDYSRKTFTGYDNSAVYLLQFQDDFSLKELR